MFSGKQLRAARALLDWGIEKLAEEVGVNKDTIFNIEKGLSKPRDNTVKIINDIFEENGVEFTPDEGVRMRHSDLIKYHGVEGFKKLMDDIYEVAKNSTPAEQQAYPIYCSSVDDKLFIKYLGDFFIEHIRRMTALKLKTRMHILIKDKPHSYRPEEEDWGYRQYRRYPSKIKMMSDTVFYAYGRKLAILMLSGHGAPHVVIIDSPLPAKAYREQFELMWQMAIPLEKDELSILAKRNKDKGDRSAKRKDAKK